MEEVCCLYPWFHVLRLPCTHSSRPPAYSSNLLQCHFPPSCLFFRYTGCCRSFGHSSHIPLALTIPMHIDLYGFHLQLLPLQFLLAARPACSTVRQAESARELTPLRSSFQLIPDASWLIKTPASPTAGISEASSTLSPWVPQCEWVLVAHNTTAW